MTIYRHMNHAEHRAQERANERGDLWAVYRRLADYLAAPANPVGFSFPGGRDQWALVQRIMPTRWDR